MPMATRCSGVSTLAGRGTAGARLVAVPQTRLLGTAAARFGGGCSAMQRPRVTMSVRIGETLVKQGASGEGLGGDR